jgi:hypothetical protein
MALATGHIFEPSAFPCGLDSGSPPALRRRQRRPSCDKPHHVCTDGGRYHPSCPSGSERACLGASQPVRGRVNLSGGESTCPGASQPVREHDHRPPTPDRAPERAMDVREHYQRSRALDWAPEQVVGHLRLTPRPPRQRRSSAPRGLPHRTPQPAPGGGSLERRRFGVYPWDCRRQLPAAAGECRIGEARHAVRAHAGGEPQALTAPLVAWNELPPDPHPASAATKARASTIRVTSLKWAAPLVALHAAEGARRRAGQARAIRAHSLRRAAGAAP